ncbi:MAG: DUF6492 family protein [Nitrospirae bacterium]|nr:DUF6492 family protein [Nitrospirota bacterium]
MEGIAIFCKSYRNDLGRASELVESVRRFNRDGLPFCLSVPGNDAALFRNRIGTGDVQWLRDEDVIGANRNISSDAYRALPGQLSQQIVKAEFWRLNPSASCLCVDSDSLFIREFGRSDFLVSGGAPYTVMHEGKAFREFCLANGLERALEEFEIMKGKFKDFFDRRGPSYNFGPLPVTWHRDVWKDLERHCLIPRGMTILDALTSLPSEAFWYGEALLKYRSIEIVPREPYFKAYLFLEEYEHDRRRGVTQGMLSERYCGVVYQSNWHPKRLTFMKNRAYRVKKILKKFLKGSCL